MLPSWEVKARYDSTDQKPHMGLLLLVPKKSQMGYELEVGPSFSSGSNGQSQIQSLQCNIRGHIFSFVYCRSTPTYVESEWLLNNMANCNYVLGDLNLDPKVADQHNKISRISGLEKSKLLNETTTKYNNQLDHILGQSQQHVKVFTTAYTNFVSDHKSITIRISESKANFIEDPRLISSIQYKEIAPSSEDEVEEEMEMEN